MAKKAKPSKKERRAGEFFLLRVPGVSLAISSNIKIVTKYAWHLEKLLNPDLPAS